MNSKTVARRASETLPAPIVLVIALLLGASAPAQAQWDDPYERSSYPAEDTGDRMRSSHSSPGSWDEPGLGMRLGMGLADDPNMFLLDLALPYHTGGGVSVGPRIQLGFADERSMVAPTIGFEYAHDLSNQFDGVLARVRPLIGAGIGFMWLEKENRAGKNTDTGFLIDVNTGLEYALSEKFSLATVIDFDISPEDTLGENLIFTWQILQMRVRF